MQRLTRKGLLFTVFLVLAAWLLAPPLQAATREYEIKAGFIYNFMRYVEWPRPASSWTVGVLGNDPFEGGLRDFEAKPLAGKSISVRALADQKEAKTCQMIYIASSESSHLKTIFASLAGSQVLTVSDIPEFADKGGGIGLVTQNNRIRFIVNLDALKQANLKADARFLNLAIRTISSNPDSQQIWNATTYLPPDGGMMNPSKLFGP